MKTLWVHRAIDAPATVVWNLFTDPEHWAKWGPSVSRAEIAGGRLALGATGTVTTILGVSLDFEVTDYEEGVRWAWKVGGLPATDHTVEVLGPNRCRVGIGAPWPAGAYLSICQFALRNLDELANTEVSKS